jgi:hypothetical protein
MAPCEDFCEIEKRWRTAIKSRSRTREAFMSRISLEESPSAIEVERALKSIEEAEYCLCGIPYCKGHEDRGGFIEIEASRLPALKKGKS